MMNYAFELGDALCTSVVARQADGTIIAARNLDFAFADAVRNITFKAEVFKKGVHIYDSVTFAGFVGVFTAHKANKYTISLNARGEEKSVANYFEVMSEIYVGIAEIAMAARDIVESCDDYACLMSTVPDSSTVVNMYFIVAGVNPNEGAVISKSKFAGADNIRTLSDDTWYLLQTNDDHFAGACAQRCQDGNAHIQAIGKDNISYDTLFHDVILQPHNLNSMTIYTTMCIPSQGIFNAFGFNSDTPYVHQALPDDLF